MSKQKPTGLAAFTVAPQTPPPKARKKGMNSSIRFPVRLAADQWERIHHLAASERTSLQQLAVEGLSLLFAQRGLPPL